MGLRRLSQLYPGCLKTGQKQPLSRHYSWELARTALVQCGLVAKRYSPYLQGFYERIKQRRGGGKAKIALARKLVKIVYDTLKNQWVFEDFPSFTLAA